MNIWGKSLLHDYGRRHAKAKGSLESWLNIAILASWKTSAEVLASFGSAKRIKGNRMRFKICGNKHRMVVEFNYESGNAHIRWLGTHDEYDRIDPETV